MHVAAFEGPLGALGAAAGAAAFVMGAFWKYEDVASPEAKMTVTRWLKYVGPPANYPGWADHLVVAFNKIFGEQHFSLKCVFRSWLASVIAISIMLSIWGLLRPNELRSVFLIQSAASIAGMYVAASFLYFIPNYWSYMKTRLILKAIAKSETATRVLLFAALDTLLTVMIFFLSTTAFTVPSLAVPDIPLDESVERLGLIFTLHARLEGGISFGVFFYAALFVSAWSWLYALTALGTRFMVRLFPKLLTSTVWFFDVDGHPLRSLGCIAGGIVFIGVLAGKAFA